MLKPSEMGVTGRKRSISAHEQLVLKKLNSLSNKKVASVCKDILMSKSGDKINIPAGVNQQHLNEITNYFAEVAGPVLAVKNGLISGIRMTNLCEYSTSDTEALYDFVVYKNSQPVLISNKALEGATNTLKPGNVIQILNEKANAALKKKWEKTVPYKVMKVLDESNVVSGPITAIKEFYPSTFPSIKMQDYDKVIRVMSTGNEAKIPKSDVPKSFMDIIMANPDAAANFKKHGAALASMINFLFEKELTKYSKNDDSYHELFVDVTSKSVLFMKFGIDRNGVMTAMISDPRKATKKAYLRSKQGVERRSSSTGKLKLDKMGFQP
jgi:hypothetical protein